MCIDNRVYHFTLLTVLLSFPLAAGTPEPFSQPLFIIERSKNANKVHYEAHLTRDSVLDIRKPVHAFWINWEKDSSGKKCEELNLIEKRMAFGFSVNRSRNPQSCVMKLVCFPHRPIKVFISDGTARAETAINTRAAYLYKIRVVTREKKVMPQVISITVFGTDVVTGEKVEETITSR